MINEYTDQFPVAAEDTLLNTTNIYPDTDLPKTEVRRKKQNYYFDTDARKIVQGDKQLKEHIAQNGSVDSVINLSDALRLGDIPELNPEVENYDTSEWGREEFIRYGKWLLKVVAPPQVPGEKQLNEKVIRRARRLGLGPGVSAFKTQFGTVSKFYMELSGSATHKSGLYDDWATDDYIKYLKRLGQKLDRRPTIPDLKKTNAFKVAGPGYYIIHTHFAEIGGFSKALELAGFLLIEGWGQEEYIDWGKKFMLANDGLTPSARALAFLSKKDFGPSDTTVKKKFGALSDYQLEVCNSYLQEVEAREHFRQTKLDEIHQGLIDGSLPAELFDGVESEEEMILRYAKYITVDYLLGDEYAVSKMSICTESTDTVRTKGFEKSIRHAAPHITMGDIESSALSQDVFDILWPFDEYMTRLKLGQEYYDFVRQRNAPDIALKKQKRQAKRQAAALPTA